MKMLFRKTILVALVAALAAAALPFVSVSAAGRMHTFPQGQISNERLERVWARQLRTYERLGQGFERKRRLSAKSSS